MFLSVLLMLFLLLGSSGCAKLKHLNAYDPATILPNPNASSLDYAKHVGIITPSSLQISWDTSTEDSLYFYAVARSTSPMNLKNIRVPDATMALIISEIKKLDTTALWGMTDAATIQAKMPVFASTFHAVAIYPDANTVENNDTGLTASTKYYYSVLVFLKNINGYSVTSELTLETPPDLSVGGGMRTCELLFPYRDINQVTYCVDIDPVNNLLYVGGYSYYMNRKFNPPLAVPANDYYILKRDLDTAFNSGQIWESQSIIVSDLDMIDYSAATGVPNVNIHRFKGFAADNSQRVYLADTRFPEWTVYMVTNGSTGNDILQDTSVMVSNNASGIVDDYTSFFYLDSANNSLYILGDDIRVLFADTLVENTTISPITISTSVPIRLNGIAFNSTGKIFVSDSENSKVYELIWDGVQYRPQLFLGSEAGSKYGQFNNVADLAFDTSDNIYVADTDNHRVQKFDKNGNFLTSINLKELLGNNAEYPRGLKINNNKLYVACAKNIYEIPIQ